MKSLMAKQDLTQHHAQNLHPNLGPSQSQGPDLTQGHQCDHTQGPGLVLPIPDHTPEAIQDQGAGQELDQTGDVDPIPVLEAHTTEGVESKTFVEFFF